MSNVVTCYQTKVASWVFLRQRSMHAWCSRKKKKHGTPSGPFPLVSWCVLYALLAFLQFRFGFSHLGSSWCNLFSRFVCIYLSPFLDVWWCLHMFAGMLLTRRPGWCWMCWSDEGKRTGCFIKWHVPTGVTADCGCSDGCSFYIWCGLYKMLDLIKDSASLSLSFHF